MKKKSSAQRILNYGKYFIKEIIPVTVGILIALSIGNWNQQKKDRKYLNEVNEIIHNELDETLEDIDFVIPLQERLIDSLDYYAKNDSVSILQIIIKNGDGIRAPTIRTNAWRALSGSKIELIDYKNLSMLANIEEQNEILKAKTNEMMSMLYPNLNSTSEDKKQIIELLLTDIISNENTVKSFIEAYKNLETESK